MRHLILALAATTALTACQEGGNPFKINAKPNADAAADAPAEEVTKGATSVKLVDRDVEAPEVFQESAEALWDGRPSLGGVWVASPDAIDPERVILRNPANGKFVIGALFRRERENPGPKLQISSDAAAALGLLAGQPGKISVTALRREETPAETNANKPILDAAEAVQTTDIGAVATSALDKAAPAGKPAAGAAAVKPAAGGAKSAAQTATQPKAPVITETKPATVAPVAAQGGAHVIQIGIFSVEANAKRAADTLTKAGVAASVKPGQTQGKAFWSVTVSGGGDKAALLKKVKGLGFNDAYFTSK